MIFGIVYLSNVLKDLLYEVEKLFAVDVIFESEFGVVLHHFLEDCIGCFLVYALSVADKFDMLFGFFIVYHILLGLGCLG